MAEPCCASLRQGCAGLDSGVQSVGQALLRLLEPRSSGAERGQVGWGQGQGRV